MCCLIIALLGCNATYTKLKEQEPDYKQSEIFRQFEKLSAALEAYDTSRGTPDIRMLVGFPMKFIRDKNKIYTLFSFGKPVYFPGSETDSWQAKASAMRIFNPETPASVLIIRSNKYFAVEGELPISKYLTKQMTHTPYLYCFPGKRSRGQAAFNEEMLVLPADSFPDKSLIPFDKNIPVFTALSAANAVLQNDGNISEHKDASDTIGNDSSHASGTDYQSYGIKAPAVPAKLSDMKYSPIFIGEDIYELRWPSSPVPKDLSFEISIKKTIEFYSKLLKLPEESFLPNSDMERFFTWLKEYGASLKMEKQKSKN